MAMRWRSDGRLLCAAMSKPEDGDFYIDDRLHYQLAVISKAVLADVDHKTNGLWHWEHEEGRPSLSACLS